MCTSIAAGKEATNSSVTLISRNEDCERNNWNKYMVYRKAPEYYPSQNNPLVKGDKWLLGNGLSVKVPKNHYAYSAIPDAMGYDEATAGIKDHYFFEERGINERNVALSATNSMCTRASEPKEKDGVKNSRYDEACQKMQALDPFVSIGIEEAIITTLILPQAKSAKHAIKLLGRYVEKYGASEGNGVLMSDVNEVWYMEIASGHHWIAVRVPNDHYVAIANGLRIHGIDLESREVLHSKALFEFVADNHFLEHPQRDNFNFAQAFGILGDPYNDDRVWLIQERLTPSKVQKPPKIQDRDKVAGTKQAFHQYPLFLKPDNPIALEDVMRTLRANYEGTVLEGRAQRSIGVFQTGESHIITLDISMPKALQGVIWQVISTPLGAPYIPIYSVVDEVPPNYSLGSDRYSSLSAFWSFRGLLALAQNNPNNQEKVENFWMHYEQSSIDEHPSINSMLKNMDKKSAIEFAKRYSIGLLYDALNKANAKRSDVMTQMTLTQGTIDLRLKRYNH